MISIINIDGKYAYINPIFPVQQCAALKISWQKLQCPENDYK